MRIDKYLWAIRQFKTRSQAVEAIKSGRVVIDEVPVKPSFTLKGGEEIKIKHNPIWRTIKVKSLLKNRVKAAMVSEFAEDITSPEELEKLEMMKLVPGFDRPRGLGRPTKKERRNIDKLRDL